MNFELEPWEIPPGADASNLSVPIEFGPVEWNGEQTMISARTVPTKSRQSLAYFRPHAVEMNFVLMQGQRPNVFESINVGKLERVVKRAIKGQDFRFARLFYYRGQRALLTQRETVWTAPETPREFDTEFELPFGWLEKSSELVLDWLEQQWQRPDSDLRFSWEWNQKTPEQRHHYLTIQVDRWRELFDLMHAIACVEALPIQTRWILDHVDAHNHAPELLASLQPWRELLGEHFLPFKPFPVSAPFCLRLYFSFISSHIQVKGAEVSAHQQLEAKLFLRDWLQRHAPNKLHLIQ